jgi:transposase
MSRTSGPGSPVAIATLASGGYDLYRLLASMGVACDVFAPSLILKGGVGPGEDRRDSFRMAWLHRAGELTAIRVPSPAEEAVRDLARVRSAVFPIASARSSG